MDHSINFENKNLNNQYLQAILDNDFEKMNVLLGALHQEISVMENTRFDEQYKLIKNKVSLYDYSVTFNRIEIALGIIDDKTRNELLQRIKNYKNSKEDQEHKNDCEKAIEVIQNKKSDKYSEICFIIYYDQETFKFLESKTPKLEEFVKQQTELFQNELKSNKYYIEKTISEYNEEINRHGEELERFHEHFNERINEYNEEINQKIDELKKLLEDPNLPEFPDENTLDLTDDEITKIQVLEKQIINLEKLVVMSGKERNPSLVTKTQETQTDFTLTHDPEMNDVEQKTTSPNNKN